MRILSFLAPLLIIGLSASLALAAPTLKVDMQSQDGALSWIFSVSDGALEGSALKANFVKNRLVIEVEGVEATRAWQKPWAKHPKVSRALIYPSKQRRAKAYVKVKFARRVPGEVREGLKTIKTGEYVVVSLPMEGVKDWSAKGKEMIDLSEPTAEPAEEATQVEEEDNLKLSASSAVLDRPAAEAPQTFEDPDAHSPEPNELTRLHSELALAQAQVAKSSSAVPRILALPFGLLNVAESERGPLEGYAKVSNAYLDAQMHHNADLIWIDDPRVRAHAEQLRDEEQLITVPKARALAAHEGADFVLRTGLRFEPGRAGIIRINSQLTSTMSGEIQEEFNYFLSEAKMKEAFEQAWREETRSGAIWRAAAFPGWGHIYRGRSASGWGYAGMGIALLTGAVVSAIASKVAHDDYNVNDPMTSHRRQDANAHIDRANLLFVGFGATWLSSLLSTVATAEDRSYLDVNALDMSEMEVSK